MSAKKEWATAGELAVGTKVHRESMDVSIGAGAMVGPLRVERFTVGERYTHTVRNGRGEVLERRTHDRIALLDSRGRKAGSVRPGDGLALGWPE